MIRASAVGKKRKPRARPEQALQIAVATFLRHALRPPVLWSAFPAGGGGAIRGSILKAMGLRAGMPDVIVIAPGSLLVGLELKSEKGDQSPEQRALEGDWVSCGGYYHVCRSVDEVEGFLRGVRVPLHARIVEGGRGILKAAA